MLSCLPAMMLSACLSAGTGLSDQVPRDAAFGSIKPIEWPSDRLLVGVAELHGTNETPALVSALASELLADGYAVTVLVEMPHEAVNYASATSPEQALRASPWWSRLQRDGREGLASACMLYDLRRRYPEIEIIGVDGTNPIDREAGMGEAIVTALSATPGRHAGVFLAGNLHVLDTPDGSPNAMSMATAALPDRKSIRIDVLAQQGSYTTCTDTCRPRNVQPFPDLRLGMATSRREWSYAFREFTPQARAVDALTGDNTFEHACSTLNESTDSAA